MPARWNLYIPIHALKASCQRFRPMLACRRTAAMLMVRAVMRVVLAVLVSCLEIGGEVSIDLYLLKHPGIAMLQQDGLFSFIKFNVFCMTWRLSDRSVQLNFRQGGRLPCSSSSRLAATITVCLHVSCDQNRTVMLGSA